MSRKSKKVEKVTVMSKTKQMIEVSPEFETVADHGHYMISAALDIMESTFGNRELHEQTTGKKNTFYCSPEQIDLIFYLIYEAATDARKLRDALTPR
jgi:hypothetical protein